MIPMMMIVAVYRTENRWRAWQPPLRDRQIERPTVMTHTVAVISIEPGATTRQAAGPLQMVAKDQLKDLLADAYYVRDGKLFLKFADDFQGVWSFGDLDLDMSHVRPETAKRSTSGTSVTVKNKWGDDVELDSSSLRALTDPTYAAELNNALDALARQADL